MGSAAKRKYLLETFPGLRDDHIGDSRSTSFEGLVRNATRGKGVHLCLNALSDEKLQARSSLLPDLAAEQLQRLCSAGGLHGRAACSQPCPIKR